jgi:hypothetical protein
LTNDNFNAILFFELSNYNNSKGRVKNGKRKILTAGLAAQAALCVALVLALPAADQRARGGVFGAGAGAVCADRAAPAGAVAFGGAGNALAVILYAR